MTNNGNKSTRKQKVLGWKTTLKSPANESDEKTPEQLCRNLAAMLNAFEPDADIKKTFSKTSVHWKTVAQHQGKNYLLQRAVLTMSTLYGITKSSFTHFMLEKAARDDCPAHLLDETFIRQGLHRIAKGPLGAIKRSFDWFRVDAFAATHKVQESTATDRWLFNRYTIELIARDMRVALVMHTSDRMGDQLPRHADYLVQLWLHDIRADFSG